MPLIWQWGGFTTVLQLLDALASFVDRLEFDFVIPLSDSDLALRTNEEMVRPFPAGTLAHTAV